MKLGIVLPQHDAGRGELLHAAKMAEDAGLDSIWAFDNLEPKPGFGSLLECWSALAAAAAVTDRVTLGPLILRVTLRTPAIAAGMARSLDEIAQGRLIMALGTGDTSTREEMLRGGYPWSGFTERLAMLQTQIESLRAQAPRVPVWIGGTGPRILSLLPLADGWSYWGPAAGYGQAAIRAMEAAGGRSIETCWGGTSLDRAGLCELREQKADHAVLAVGARNYAERIGWLTSMREDLRL